MFSLRIKFDDYSKIKKKRTQKPGLAKDQIISEVAEGSDDPLTTD